MKKQDIEHLARLARLSVSATEQDTLSKELGDILNWVNMLDEVDTSNVAPLYSVHDNNQLLHEDVLQQLGDAHDVLKNAPDKILLDEGGYFVVPKVVE